MYTISSIPSPFRTDDRDETERTFTRRSSSAPKARMRANCEISGLAIEGYGGCTTNNRTGKNLYRIFLLTFKYPLPGHQGVNLMKISFFVGCLSLIYGIYIPHSGRCCPRKRNSGTLEHRPNSCFHHSVIGTDSICTSCCPSINNALFCYKRAH